MPEVQKPVIRAVRAEITMGKNGVSAGVSGETFAGDVYSLPKMETPDVTGYIQGKTELTRATILEILKRSGRLPDIMVNPQLFLDLAVNEISSVLHDLMIDGLKYEKIAGADYAMMLFSDRDVETYKDNLYKITKAEKTIADHIIIDSMSKVEKKFAEDCENNDNVEFFIKLPDWFTIQTPVGEYNPDWALIYKMRASLFYCRNEVHH